MLMKISVHAGNRFLKFEQLLVGISVKFQAYAHHFRKIIYLM